MAVTWTEILGEEMGLMFEPQRYPTTSQEFTARTGVTPNSIYLFEEASGNLEDAVGSSDLTVGASPTFGYQTQGRRGIFYDAAGDYHRADVHAVGSGSFMFGIVACFLTNPGATRFFGTRRFTGAAPEQSYGIFIPAATHGRPVWDMRDGVSTIQITAPATIDMRAAASLTVPHLIIGQRDNTAAVGRVHVWSMTGGFLGEAEGSIVGLGSLNIAGQVFGFGSPLSNLGQDTWFGYSFIATGSQCEGATKPHTIADALGWA